MLMCTTTNTTESHKPARMFVCLCVCLQKHFSGEILHNTKFTHTKALRSFPFLGWHMYFNAVSSSLSFYRRAFQKFFLTGSEIYCTERCSAKWDSHLKDNHRSKYSLLLTQEPNILHFCQYAFSWMRISKSSELVKAKAKMLNLLIP